MAVGPPQMRPQREANCLQAAQSVTAAEQTCFSPSHGPGHWPALGWAGARQPCHTEPGWGYLCSASAEPRVPVPSPLSNQRLHVALPLLSGFQYKLLTSQEAGLPVPRAGVSIPFKDQVASHPLFSPRCQCMITGPTPHVCACVCAHAQPCPTLCDPMDCSLPSSSIHGFIQARIPEWVVIFYSRGIFLTQGLNLCLLCLLHWQVDSVPQSINFQKKNCTSVVIKY